mgnify:CR=1 FL=1
MYAQLWWGVCGGQVVPQGKEGAETRKQPQHLQTCSGLHASGERERPKSQERVHTMGNSVTSSKISQCIPQTTRRVHSGPAPLHCTGLYCPALR